jgi:hypothetical protein
MNTCQYLDGFVACAMTAHNNGHPETMLVATLSPDYAVGWQDALCSAALFRCMKREILESYAPDCARFSLALRSSTVKGCEKCRGKGWLRVGYDEDFDQVDCTCIEQALDDIAAEIGR